MFDDYMIAIIMNDYDKSKNIKNLKNYPKNYSNNYSNNYSKKLTYLEKDNFYLSCLILSMF